MLQKSRRVKLEPEDYKLLRLKVLERDRWRCQACSSLNNLQVHHLRKRRKLGDDLLDNLITLCATCHMTEHRRE